tara:strand:- start:1013 stop:1342 length:330 start_codon:yes stop_codon:yes gene_type:complete
MMTEDSRSIAPLLSGGVEARVPDPPVLPEPPAWRRWWSWWLGKSVIIAGKQNRILCWMAFYCGIAPVALWLRWTGQDRIDRQVRPVGESGWNPREQPIAVDPDRVRRPV